jgi:hypothetical protein
MRLISGFGPALDGDLDDVSRDADPTGAEVGDLTQQAEAQAHTQELRRQVNAADDRRSTAVDDDHSESEHHRLGPSVVRNRLAQDRYHVWLLGIRMRTLASISGPGDVTRWLAPTHQGAGRP